MNWRESRRGVAFSEFAHQTPWILAVLLFGVGDLVTTAVGLGIPGIVEADPLARALIDRFGIGSLVGLKLVAFALCFAVWQTVPRPYSRGVPIGLAALGGAVTAWNVLVVASTVGPL